MTTHRDKPNPVGFFIRAGAAHKVLIQTLVSILCLIQGVFRRFIGLHPWFQMVIHARELLLKSRSRLRSSAQNLRTDLNSSTPVQVRSGQPMLQEKWFGYQDLFLVTIRTNWVGEIAESSSTWQLAVSQLAGNRFDRRSGGIPSDNDWQPSIQRK
jgi:hypothetical protein